MQIFTLTKVMLSTMVRMKMLRMPTHSDLLEDVLHTADSICSS